MDFDFAREGGRMEFDINFLAVLLAAVAHQVLIPLVRRPIPRCPADG